jgi:lysophospholipase L1-like esterase
LENCRIRFERKKTGRVVFLGGSITAGGAWLQSVKTYLAKRFPTTKFDFINAGIGSMGSTPHAFRYSRDVRKCGSVDLLFVEAAVNDEANGRTPLEMVRGMEGVVRQARITDPLLDIVMLHFADEPKLVAIAAGSVPPVIACHERVAAAYAIPSLDLSLEVAERIGAGQFTWEEDFVGLHPSPFGHALYGRAVIRLLEAAWELPLPPVTWRKTYRLPSRPLDEKSYFRGRLVSLEAATISGNCAGGWELIPRWRPRSVPGLVIETREGFVDVPTLVAETPGTTLEFEFVGTAVGLFVASGPDAGTVEFRIDGGAYASRDLFTDWSPYLHLPRAEILSADLSLDAHRMELRVAETAHPLSQGTAVRIMHFLVN